MKKKKLDYKIYSAGEVARLYDAIKNEKVNKEIRNSYTRNRFSDILYEIIKNLRTLTLEYLKIKVKNRKRYIYGNKFFVEDDFKSIIRILFEEDIDMMPLYINDPIIGVIATWGLKIGK